MKIEINNDQYAYLIKAIGLAVQIYGVMGDMVDEKYKSNLNEVEGLEKYFLKYAKDFDYNQSNYEQYDGENVLSQEYFEKIALDIANYEQFVFWDLLTKKMAEKELMSMYSFEQLNSIGDDEFVHKAMDMEDKYYQEFSKNGLDNLYIQK